MTRLEEVGRVRHLLQLRERLGLDPNPNPTTKTEKDVCNLAARASTTSPVHMVIPPSPQTPIQETQSIVPDREYTKREQDLMIKCINLVQGRIGSNQKTDATTATGTATNPQIDASPGDEGCDMNMSYLSSNSIELCSPDRVDIPNGWEPPMVPAPAVQPVLPLRLYVPELEEIRISPVVARKGNKKKNKKNSTKKKIDATLELSNTKFQYDRLSKCIRTWWFRLEKTLGYRTTTVCIDIPFRKRSR